MPRNIVTTWLSKNNQSKGLTQNIWGPHAIEAVKQALIADGLELNVEQDSLTVFDYEPYGNGTYSTNVLATQGPLPHFPLESTSKISGRAELLAINNAFIHNWNGYHIVYKDSMVQVSASSMYAPIKQMMERKDFEPKSSSVVSLDEAYILFDDNDPNNYCHFILEYLSQIYLLDKNKIRIPIIIPFGLNLAFHLETINILRLKGYSIVELPEGCALFLKKMYILKNKSSFSHPIFKCNINAINFIRDLFFKGEVTDIKNNKLCWISRKGTRFLLNENNIISEISKSIEVDKFDLSNLSISQQAQIFSSYKYFVGPHGAAFTNIIYSKPKTSLVEIFAQGNGTPSFTIICDAIDIKHYSYFGQSIDTGYSNYPNMIVNEKIFPAELLKSLGV